METAKQIICTVCPTGCIVEVSGTPGALVSAGHTCRRGKAYAESEYVLPVRILTSCAATDSHAEPRLPVRTTAPIPKALHAACMAEIKKLTLSAPVCRHDVLIANVLDTGADIVATGSLM